MRLPHEYSTFMTLFVEEMAKLEQYHSQLTSKYEKNTIRWVKSSSESFFKIANNGKILWTNRDKAYKSFPKSWILKSTFSIFFSSASTQLITNTEIVQQNKNFQQKNFSVRRVRSPSLPPIDKTMARWVICLELSNQENFHKILEKLSWNTEGTEGIGALNSAIGT